MASKTETERLAVVETKIDLLTDEVKKLGDKMDALLPTYVTIEKHEKDMAELKRKSGFQLWLTSTLTAAFAVVMTILIQGYFSK